MELLIGVQLSRHELVDSLCYWVGERSLTVVCVVGPNNSTVYY